MTVKYISSLADGTRDGSQPTNGSAGIGPWTFAQMVAATPAAGDEMRVMADGVYTFSATNTIAWANGTQAANILIHGANTSGVVDGTRPTLRASAGSITILSITGSHIRLRYLIADGNSQATTTGISLAASYTRMLNCKAMGCTAKGISLGDGFNSIKAILCEASGCSGTCGIYVGSGGPSAVLCESHGGTCHGFQFSASGHATLCLAYANTGASTDGFNGTSVGYEALLCAAYGNGRSGFDVTSNAGFGTLLANCLAYGNAGAQFNSDGVKDGAFLFNCAGGGGTSNYNAAQLLNVFNFQALTGNPFTNAAGGDFSLNNTAGAGAACRAAGIPGAYPAGTTTGHIDIGAAQHADPAGGSGGGAPIIGSSIVRGLGRIA